MTPAKTVLVDHKGRPYLVRVTTDTTDGEVLKEIGEEGRLNLDIPEDRSLNDLGVKPGEIRNIRVLNQDFALLRRK